MYRISDVDPTAAAWFNSNMTEELSKRIDDLHKRFDDLRADVNQRFAEINQRFGELREDMNQKLTTFMWIVSGWFTFLTAVLAVFGFLRP